MKLTAKKILLLTLLVEGVLLGISLVWIYYRELVLSSPPTIWQIFIGVLSSIPLLAVNFILFEILSSRVAILHSFATFRNEIAEPIASALNWTEALFVSIAAGFCEELFFRGVLQPEFGIFIASAIFALMHFGGSAREFRLLTTLYVIIGIYFGLLAQLNSNLWVPAIGHSVYDFVALQYLRLNRRR